MLRAAQAIFWFLAVICMVVIPWFFGGMGPDGYFFTVWVGWACGLPLGLWLASRVLKRRWPRMSFWLPVVCWGLLAVQVVLSTHNRSHAPQAPWVGSGFDAVPHEQAWPSTAYKGATAREGLLWISIGLVALTARVVGLGERWLLRLMWIFLGNATVLALAGLPARFSGGMKILGRWPAQESYFYSSFLYHNHWCPFALLAAAVGIGLVVTSKTPVAKAVALGMVAVLVASAPISISRMGTLMMLGLVGWAVGYWWVRRTGKRTRRGQQAGGRWRAAWVSGGVILVLLGGVLFFYVNQDKERGGHRSWGTISGANPLGGRWMLVEDTWPMIEEKPWFGWGLGAYGAAFRGFQRPETRIVHNQGRITLYDHAHNDWVERLAELGAVGFTLFLAPGVYWLWRRWRQGAWSGYSYWMALGCLGVLVYAWGDMVFVNIAVSLSFSILFGVMCTQAKTQPRIRESLKENPLQD